MVDILWVGRIGDRPLNAQIEALRELYQDKVRIFYVDRDVYRREDIVFNCRPGSPYKKYRDVVYDSEQDSGYAYLCQRGVKPLRPISHAQPIDYGVLMEDDECRQLEYSVLTDLDEYRQFANSQDEVPSTIMPSFVRFVRVVSTELQYAEALPNPLVRRVLRYTATSSHFFRWGKEEHVELQRLYGSEVKIIPDERPFRTIRELVDRKQKCGADEVVLDVTHSVFAKLLNNQELFRRFGVFPLRAHYGLGKNTGSVPQPGSNFRRFSRVVAARYEIEEDVRPLEEG